MRLVSKLISSKIFSVIIWTPFLFSCTDNPLHINRSVYKIKAGETIEIYTTTNSCCYYCLPQDRELKCIQFVNTQTVEKEPEGCDGCSHTDGWIFKALQPGTDTIQLKKITGGNTCSDPGAATEQYMVIVE